METFETLATVSILLLGLFLVLSIADGIYLHLFYYRLPEHPESRFEHLMHTFRAILFIPIVLGIFYFNLSGPLLWLTMVVVFVDLGFEAKDVLEERRSRMRLGGLMSGEYLLHICETTLRVAAMAIMLAAKPIAAWQSAIELPQFPALVRLLALVFTAGSVAVATLHLVLIPFPFFVTKLVGNAGRQH